MKINQERLQKYIQDKHASPCPLCGNNHWTFNDTIFQLTEFSTESFIVGGTVFPVIPLTCNNCGNTYFINVLSANLIDKPSIEKDQDKDGAPK